MSVATSKRARPGRESLADAPLRGATRSPKRSYEVAQLAEIQRARLLAGAVSAVDELGYARTTVADITARSRVSRRTFYELFANREECLAAVLEEAVAQVRQALAPVERAELPWRERVRLGLAAILTFLDSEPALARVCIVQTLRGGPQVLERREQILAQLVSAIDEGSRQGARGRSCTQLTAEGLVGAAFSIVHARLLRGARERLIDLVGELMGLIVLPYLGPAAARREQRRAAPESPPAVRRDGVKAPSSGADPLRDVPMRLTYRTARVLEGVAEHPGANNRMVGEYAGVADQGQISKLLTRLERLDLLTNTGQGHSRGEPNAWRLTSRGAQVAHSINLRASQGRAA